MLNRVLSIVFIGLIMAACSSEKQESGIDIQFVLYHQGQMVETDQCPVDDLRFYVFQEGTDVQLLDFVSNEECRNSLEVTGSLSSQGVRNGLNFKIGVPNHLNHQNPVKAAPPLNQSAMHWQWLSGYKFLRLEYEKDEQLSRFHLGSWGCSGKIPDNVSCKEPNVIEVRLKDFIVGESVAEIHLDALLDVDSDSLCMGDPNEKTCQTWMQALRSDVFKLGKSMQ